MNFTRFKITDKQFFTFLFGFLFLRPYPISIVGKSGARVIDVAVFLLISCWVVFYARIKFSREIVAVLALILLFTILYLASFFWGAHYSIAFSNIFEILRYIMFIPFLLFGYYWAHLDEALKSYLKPLVLVFCFGFLVMLAQYLEVKGIGFLNVLYTGDVQKVSLTYDKRAIGIFGNPNTAGILMTLLGFAIFYYLRFFTESKWFQKGSYLILLGIVACIFFCASKTAFIMFFGVFTFYFARKWKFWVLVLLIAFLGYHYSEEIFEFVAEKSPYLHMGFRTWIYGSFSDFLNSEAMQARYEHWVIAIQYFYKSPLLGVGPLRGQIGSSTDGYYVYILARSGILGLIVIVFFWGSVLCHTVINRKNDLKVQYLARVVQLSTIALLIANIALEAFILMLVAYFYFVTLGYYLGHVALSRHAKEKPLKDVLKTEMVSMT